MRILRGTSIGGIAGIRGLREDLFIRPLLDCTREQVRAFVRAQRFVCVEDPTNCSQRFLRNRIRLNLLPQIRETVNPAVDQALLRLACVAERDERFIVSLAEKIELSHPDAQTVALPVEVFQSLEESVRARVLLRMLRQVLSPFANLEQKHIEQVLNYLKNPTKQKGKSWSIDLPSGVNAGMEGRFFYVRQGHTINQSFCFEVVPPCEVETPQGRIRLYFRPRQGLDPVRATKKQVFFDFCKLKPPFVIRSLKPGDCIQVWGGGGKHKVSRLLMDARVPKHYRQLVPLLVMDKTVLWVAGFQRSDVAPCCDNCFRVLVAEYIHVPNFFSYIKPQ
jgi:tRNA(Ile)-lysidine synthase